MAWVGMLASAGVILGILWVSYAVLRIKDVRLRRVLGTLEWLALQPAEMHDERWSKEWIHSLSTVRHTWRRAHSVFQLTFPRYMHLAWNASFQDLYWANRFGDELRDMSMRLRPGTQFSDAGEWERERVGIIIRHIHDFNALAVRLLAKSVDGGEADEV